MPKEAGVVSTLRSGQANLLPARFRVKKIILRVLGQSSFKIAPLAPCTASVILRNPSQNLIMLDVCSLLRFEAQLHPTSMKSVFFFRSSHSLNQLFQQRPESPRFVRLVRGIFLSGSACPCLLVCDAPLLVLCRCFQRFFRIAQLC